MELKKLLTVLQTGILFFVVILLLAIPVLADCSGRSTQAQPGSPFQYGTAFVIGNPGSWHDTGADHPIWTT
jgi:hypothetical protein